MSRVDQAMRRAAPTTSDRFRPDDVDTSHSASTTATLEQFGQERPPLAPQVDALPPPRRAPQSAPPQPTAPQPQARDAGARFLETSPAARNPKLIINPHMSPVSSTQYRRLAAALHDLQLERELKVVMVSSAVPLEGKTLTIANVALTLSESYHRRTLLIDADLRCPGLHEMFGVSKTPGLADVLGGSTGQLPLVQVSPWLNLLTAGHSAAAPLAQLTSDRLRMVVDEAAEHFDWILIDTPPVSVMPDAQHVASVSQGVLLVIAAGVTPYPLVQRAISAIGAERILGTMLNYVEDRLLQEKQLYGRYYGQEASRQ